MKVISSAPTRISLFGGGTDLPVFYENNSGGIAISIAINLRQHFEFQMSDGDSVTREILPEDSQEFISAFIPDEYSYTHKFDADINSGLGSSASFAVCMVGGMHRYMGLSVDMERSRVAQTAWNIEVNELGLYGGKQDQFAAVMGGMNVFRFYKSEVRRKEFTRAVAEFWVDNIVLVDTGLRRENTKIQENLVELSPDQTEKLIKTKELAHKAVEPIENMDVGSVVELLKEAWETKKATNSISNPKIDKIYNEGIKNGALAGKLLGSGGGGYMIFIVPPYLQKNFDNKIDFSVDYNGLETRIINR